MIATKIQTDFHQDPVLENVNVIATTHAKTAKIPPSALAPDAIATNSNESVSAKIRRLPEAEKKVTNNGQRRHAEIRTQELGLMEAITKTPRGMMVDNIPTKSGIRRFLLITKNEIVVRNTNRRQFNTLMSNTETSM
ncbi:glutamate synthase large subunit [Aurantimicrobium minutum]|uniref:Glutamate synthase large subunit n=1 Tax=Aurantimicrobium minutum TaxID=708131 RepID=A0A173LV71_9MICO|nr:glutamate synthase large subunit [Aurantimicrobium minutum]